MSKTQYQLILAAVVAVCLGYLHYAVLRAIYCGDPSTNPIFLPACVSQEHHYIAAFSAVASVLGLAIYLKETL